MYHYIGLELASKGKTFSLASKGNNIPPGLKEKQHSPWPQRETTFSLASKRNNIPPGLKEKNIHTGLKGEKTIGPTFHRAN
jgi:hypothetical protein